MSEFHIQVVRLGSFTQHPNSDRGLRITKVFDYTVITASEEFQEGNLAVYIPVDAVVPDNEQWYWLAPKNPDGTDRFKVGEVPDKYRTIGAKKIRGTFSQGLLAPLPPGNWKEGDDVRLAMGITKYEPPEPLSTYGECEKAPQDWFFTTYTDIEGLRRYPNILNQGEEVIITEKLEGANGRYIHDGNRLWVGSHNQIKKFDPKNLWWKVAIQDSLAEKLSHTPMYIYFGEVFGQVKNFNYGVKSGAQFRVFDVYSVKDQKYLDFDDAYAMATGISLEWVPILYRGPWDVEKCNPLCEGNTTISFNVGEIATVFPANHIREGFVVRPTKERWSEQTGRVILKRHGEEYLLRKKR